MYIEFQIPFGAGGAAAGHALGLIKKHVEIWSQKHNIPYTSKTIKYTHRVCFDNNDNYLFFSLTWNPNNINLPRWRIVSDLNNRL